MALSEGGSPETPPDITSYQHFSTPLDNPTANDDSDEWEYEYSNRETETYYLTLDLTTPSTPCARSHVPRVGRGGHKSTWINPGLYRQKNHSEPAPTISLPRAGDRAASQNLTPTPTPVIVPTNGFGSANTAENASEDEYDRGEQQESVEDLAKESTATTELLDSTATKRPERIQILELHSKNPIITYKAHTFSCKWAENIGTELLFTFHDPERQLPVLRSLADDVELLAASSARLVSKSVKLVPKAPACGKFDVEYVGQQNKSPAGSDQRVGGIAIPVGSGASNSRKEQARFLERMIEVKQKKGEKDSVTVVAQRRLYPAGWRTVLKEKRAGERTELRSVIRQGGSDAEEALKRLKEMEEEDKAAEEEERQKRENGIVRKSRAGRKPKDVDGARPTKRARGAPLFRRPRGGRSRLNLFHDNTLDFSVTAGNGDSEPETLSTPTPQRWDQRQGHEGFVENADTGDL